MVELRDAILSQRQKALGAEQPVSSPETIGGGAEILTEIRDIIGRIEAQGRTEGEHSAHWHQETQ